MKLNECLDRMITEGTAPEAIIVAVGGRNSLHGSFYVNSPVSGNWEDFIVKDLINFIDNNFRTINKPSGRGIAGHSMGGYGCLNLAMLHPEIFSSVFSMNPGLFSESGLKDSQMFSNDVIIKDFLNIISRLDKLSVESANKEYQNILDSIVYKNNDLFFAFAYGSAFSPGNLNKAPYLYYPVLSNSEGKIQLIPEIWDKWESGFGGIRKESVVYRNNLQKLKAIFVDSADKDYYAWIPQGCLYFDKVMKQAGIASELKVYEGDHGDKVAERIQTIMLPFFKSHLDCAR